jgi:flagellar biosynthesis GTPase FlhF
MSQFRRRGGKTKKRKKKEKKEKEKEKEKEEEEEEEKEEMEVEEEKEEMEAEEEEKEVKKDAMEVEEEKKVMEQKWRRESFLRMKRFQRKQEAYTTVARELKTKAHNLFRKFFPNIEPIPPIRVIWGDASFHHVRVGHPPCPNKGMQGKLRPHFDEIVAASEQRTSKTSPCCDDDVKFIDQRKRAFRCNSCNRPWNRDLGASLNIRRLWHYHQQNGKKKFPDWAKKRRTPTQSQKRTTPTQSKGDDWDVDADDWDEDDWDQDAITGVDSFW